MFDLRRLASGWLGALVLSSGLLVSAVDPAQAQVRFGFGIGPGMFYGDDELPEDNPRFRGLCLTDYALRKSLERQGYTNIFLSLANNRRIEARGTRDGVVYKLVVHSCSGRILSRQRDPRRN